MSAMGWSWSMGLGKRSDGRTSPIPTPNPPGVAARGGAAAAAGPRVGGKKVELVAYEPQVGEATFGTIGNRNGAEVLEVWGVSPRGVPSPTGEVVFLVREWGVRASQLSKALMWDGGPVGAADITYPHPQGWRLEGEPPGSTLERMTVRRLTALYRRRHTRPPTCVSTWTTLTGVDMTRVQRRFTSPILTPRDFKNYFRILHRSLRTRNIAGGDQLTCRLCHRYMDRFSHIGRCWKIRRAFRGLRELASALIGRVQMDDAFVYLGAYQGGVLTGALSDLHILVWKFVLISFTQVETQGSKFKPNTIWKQAVCRYETRVRAYLEGMRRGGLSRECRGSRRSLSESHLAKVQSYLTPAGALDEDGRFKWEPEAAAAIAKARA